MEPKTLTDWVFGTVDLQRRIITGNWPGNWPSNTLRLLGFDIYEALKVDDPKKLDWKDHIFDLHSRQLEHAVFINAKLGKVNLEGANLEGALLNDAQLQGASLDFARLQGALLFRAKLQGASLFWARLQGAALIEANLQGASLIEAELQGALLYKAQLQGASLLRAQLQGALLVGAQLQGASLDQASLQGAWLKEAQLQGTSLIMTELQGVPLDLANVNAANFSRAVLWRTGWRKLEPAKLEALQLEDATWKPVWRPYVPTLSIGPFRWDAKAYQELRGSIMSGVPSGENRDDALTRIEILDCANPDKTLASCAPAAKPPPEVLAWQKKLEAANVDDAAFAKALATELRGLVCESGINAIHILRGTISILDLRSGEETRRLAATGREAPALVDFIMSKDCPVSAALTDDDKAKLLRIKQEAEKKFAPPPTAKKEK